MNPKHFHTPLSTRARCPVCHEAVYSRAGIHPQCAVRQADPPKPKAKGPTPSFPAAPVPGSTEHEHDDVDTVIEPPTAESLTVADRTPV